MMNREELRQFRTGIIPVVSAADVAQVTGWTIIYVYSLENGNWNKKGRIHDTYSKDTEQKFINAVKEIRERKKAGTWVSQYEIDKKRRKEEKKLKLEAEEKLREKEKAKWRNEKYLADMKAFRAELKKRREAWKKYYEQKQTK